MNLGFSELQFKVPFTLKWVSLGFFMSLFSLSDLVRRGIEKQFSFRKSLCGKLDRTLSTLLFVLMFYIAIFFNYSCFKFESLYIKIH